MEFWQKVLFGGGALIVLWQTWRGWRLGVVRQLLGLLALVLAYLAAFFGRDAVLPLIRPLGLPPWLVGFVSGAALGMVVFIVVVLLSALLFKKTADQSVGVVRFGYGVFGALIGAVKGLAIVWLVFFALRLAGTVAEIEVELSKHPPAARVRERLPGDVKTKPPSPQVQELAQVKRVLEDGAVGAVMDRLDPFPAAFHRCFPKLIRVFSDDQSAQRFSEYPGTRALVSHPKLIELQRDPEIAKAVTEKNFAALLRNEHVNQALGDSDFKATLLKFELEKALDHALGPQASALPSKK